MHIQGLCISRLLASSISAVPRSAFRLVVAAVWVGVVAGVGYTAGASAASARAGGRAGILFSRARSSSPNGAGYGGNLYLWKPGGASRRLTSGSDPRDWPQWSPDGRRIAFTMAPGWNGQGACPSGSCTFEVWVMNADGSDQRRLTSDGEAGGAAPNACCTEEPSWSPNGRALVFVREFGSSPPELVVVSARGGKEKLLHATGDDPVWGRHGIAYAGPGGIRLLNLNTHRSRVLVRTPAPGLNLDWSPTGTRLAAIITPAQRVGGYPPARQHISVYSYTGRKTASFSPPLPTARTQACGVSWSPDGKHLLVTVSTTRRQGMRTRYTNLYEVGTNGKNWLHLSQHPSTCRTSWR